MEYYSVIKKEWGLAICNSMDGAREYNAEWNKSVRERQVPFDLTHVWNLRNKTNEQRKKERGKPRNTLLTRENKLMLTGGEGMGEIGDGD